MEYLSTICKNFYRRLLHLMPQQEGIFEPPACIVVFEGDSVRSEVVRIEIRKSE